MNAGPERLEGDRAYVAVQIELLTVRSPIDGVATALIEACAEIARRLGHRQLYISTSVLGGLLQRTGWQETGEARFLNDQVGSVYVRDL